MKIWYRLISKQFGPRDWVLADTDVIIKIQPCDGIELREY
jgi:hypothetical protein